jgi:Tfp pilus assembly protein PilN
MRTADRLTIIATGAAILMAVAGGSCSTNARIGDLSARIDELRTELGARIDATNARIDRLETRIDRLETRLDGIVGRLRRVEVTFGQIDQRLLTLERVLLPPPAD